MFLPPLAAAAAAPQTLQPEPNPTALPGAFLAECMPGATPPPLSNASRTFAPSGILVHLHYFEPPEMEACERANKRPNLAFFLAHAVEPSTPADGLFFHITANVLPPIGEFYASIGLPTPSRATLVPERANVRAELTTRAATTDLCYRADVIRQQEARRNVSYALFLNDGARGPFPPSSSDAAALGGAPAWLGRYAAAFRAPSVKAVGSMITCEHDAHLQSWALMIDWDARANFRDAYDATCAQDKEAAILGGEIGPHIKLLDAGGAISGLFPPALGFSGAHRACMHDHIEKGGCTNPLPFVQTPPSQAHWDDVGDLGEYTFVKFGGEQWRRRLMPEPYVAHVTRETARLLGNASGCVPAVPGAASYVADLRSDSDAISRAHRR